MQEIKLNIVPGGVIPVIHATQYDVGRELKFLIFDGNSPASLTGTTATIEGTKPDGNGFSYECTISNNEVTVETTAQMTVLSGSIDCKITFFKESDRIGTALFILDIEKAALNSNTPISETEIPAIIAQAREQEQNAEAWAVGTKNGEPVSEDDPQYENSSKWWAEYAESAVTGVTGVKGNAETNYRRGNVNLTPANIGALATNGASTNTTVAFTTKDAVETTTERTNHSTDIPSTIVKLGSGETLASMFSKVSAMFKNIRRLWNTVGSTALQSNKTITGLIGNTAIPSDLGTTITGAISNLSTLGSLKHYQWTNPGTIVKNTYWESPNISIGPGNYIVFYDIAISANAPIYAAGVIGDGVNNIGWLLQKGTTSDDSSYGIVSMTVSKSTTFRFSFFNASSTTDYALKSAKCGILRIGSYTQS